MLLGMVENTENSESSGMLVRHPEFAERLSAAMQGLGVSVTQVKNHLGITYEMARRYTLGLAMPRKDKLAQLAQMVHTSPSYLAFGFADLSLDRNIGIAAPTQRSLTLTHPSRPANAAKPHSTPVQAMDEAHVDQDVARIRKVRLRLSAGIQGFSTDPDTQDANPIFFRRDWLEKRGYIAEQLIAIRVRGQSMEPGLFEGDTVVINTADISPVDGEVYALNYEGEAVVKRMVRDSGQWWLVSDNADQRRYPRKQCHAATCIVIGRVIQKQSERI